MDKVLPQLAWLAPEFEEACSKEKFVQADASRERKWRISESSGVRGGRGEEKKRNNTNCNTDHAYIEHLPRIFDRANGEQFD